MNILKVENISKEIKGKKIINDLSLSIKKGDIFGFIGRNGSGKTTTVRMIFGLIKPTRGSVFIKGHHVEKDFTAAMKYASGIVETPSFYGFLTGWENLKQKGRLFNLTPSDDELQDITNLIGLQESIHTKSENYSLGMKQRLALGIALIGDPELIVLDEPVNGLDPQGIIEIRNLIKYLANEKGKAILISSHILAELEHIINKGIIIDHGEKVLDLTNHLQKSSEESYFYKIILYEPATVTKVKKIINDLGISIENETQESILVSVKNINILQKIIKKLLNNDIIISEIIKEDKTLEDIYLQATDKEIKS